jgi:hypothetical protein
MKLCSYADPIHRFEGVDKRTRAWRRRCELIELFTKQLPYLTESQLLDVERLSDLVVMAETMRAAMLAGKPVAVDEMAKIEELVSRLKWNIGITKPRTKVGPHKPPAGEKVALVEPLAEPKRRGRHSTETAGAVHSYLAEKGSAS